MVTLPAMRMSMMLVAVVAVVGCGSKKDGEGAVAAKGAEPAVVMKSAKELFGPRPAVPAVASKIVIGQTEAEARAAAPELFAKEYASYPVPGYDGVTLRVGIDATTRRVADVSVTVEERSYEAAKAGVAAWPKPRVVTNSAGSSFEYWDDGETGVRVMGERIGGGGSYTFSTMMPIATIVGTTPGQLGFETTPLIGMAAADVATTYAAYHPEPGPNPDSIKLELPPTELSEYSTTVIASVKDFKVTGYTLTSAYPFDKAGRDTWLPLLEKVFGAKQHPAGVPPEEDQYWEFKGPAKARASASESGINVTVGDA